MPISQNLRFTATVPNDTEFEHPPGAILMRRLSHELLVAGWRTGEMDNWRDCGWSVMCGHTAFELEVVLSQLPNGRWILQVSPSKVPGLISRLFGGRQSATIEQVHELAAAVHRSLSNADLLGDRRWRWDGFPDDNNLTPEPSAS